MQAVGYADVDYLRVAAELFKPVKDLSYKLMQVQAGQCVLDVGCGPGTDTIPLGRLVGSDGRVVGIDYDADMVATANQRAAHAGIGDFVKHYQGSASALDQETNTFDSCRAERVFLHLQQPERVLAEMFRVTKPGGAIVVAETDFGTLSFDTDHIETERCLVRVRTEHLFNNGYAGRRLYRLFNECGLVDVTVKMRPFHITDVHFMRFITGLYDVERKAVEMGRVSEEAIEDWRAEQFLAHEKGIFFASASVVMVVGFKP